jgi:hypothetical protein
VSLNKQNVFIEENRKKNLVTRSAYQVAFRAFSRFPHFPTVLFFSPNSGPHVINSYIYGLGDVPGWPYRHTRMCLKSNEKLSGYANKVLETFERSNFSLMCFKGFLGYI